MQKISHQEEAGVCDICGQETVVSDIKSNDYVVVSLCERCRGERSYE